MELYLSYGDLGSRPLPVTLPALGGGRAGQRDAAPNPVGCAFLIQCFSECIHSPTEIGPCALGVTVICLIVNKISDRNMPRVSSCGPWPRPTLVPLRVENGRSYSRGLGISLSLESISNSISRTCLTWGLRDGISPQAHRLRWVEGDPQKEDTDSKTSRFLLSHALEPRAVVSPPWLLQHRST